MNLAFQLRFGIRRHVAVQDLLAYIDGEIGSGNSQRVRRHLEACSKCHNRFEEIQNTMRRFMAYRKHKVNSYLPPAAEAKLRFLARLDEERSEAPSSEPLEAESLNAQLHKTVASTHLGFAACLVVVLTALVMLLLWRNPKTVAASELLNKAESSEAQLASAGRHFIVFQRVKISSPTTTVERLVYRDSRGRRKARATHLNQADLNLQHTLEGAGVSWERPLSAADFRRWHDQLSDPQDSVYDDQNTFTLLTRSRSTLVTQASLTVRKADFHPMRRHIVFRDFGAVDVAEVSYEVSDWNEDRADSIFEPETASLPATSSRAFTVEAPRILPSPDDLDEAELRARLALNEANADSGEQIDVRRGPSSIQIAGIIETNERKRDLEDALSRIPLVAVSLHSISDMETRPASHLAPKQQPPEYAVANQSRLQAYLENSDKDTPSVVGMIHEFLETSLVIQRETHALDVLHAKFMTPGQERLSSSSRDLLQKLVESHLERLQGGINRQRRLVNVWMRRGATDSTSGRDTYSGYELLLQEAAKNKALCDELLSAPQGNGDTADTVLIALEDSLERLDIAVNQVTHMTHEDAP